jgi:hypothetical protein
MNIIPIKATPNQTFKCVLGGQYCRVTIRTLSTGLYLDLLVNNSPIIQGRLCPNDVLLVRHAYLGFIGDLVFYDTQGIDDPDYTGLGSRYQLRYLTPAEATEHESLFADAALALAIANIPTPNQVVYQIGINFVVGSSPLS